MEVNGEIELPGAQPGRQRQFGADAGEATSTWSDDHLVQMRVVRDHRRGCRFDQVGEVGARKGAADGPDCRRREDDVADLPQPDEQDPSGKTQGSTVASSISMTGMSSLMG